MENFSFLKSDYPDLYLLCSDVARYIDSDKSISMLKARQAIEYIVKYLGAETDDLFVNINNLEDKNIASSRIIDLFHFIRKKANKSVHNAVNADTEGILEALTEICAWLVIEHDKKSVDDNNVYKDDEVFLKKYESNNVILDNSVSVTDATNPLEITGDFSSKEGFKEKDVLEQDVFETKEEYCTRIESLPGIKIGYAFLESSQIDDYCNIAFPLFHIRKHSKIESAEIVAFYVPEMNHNVNIDGVIEAKLKVFSNKIYYDYDSVILKDEDNEIKLFPICWERLGYETQNQFIERIKKLPLLPVGVAKPIRNEYDLQKQVLPFETVPMAYVSDIFTKSNIFCFLGRDEARELCSVKSPFIIYANFKDKGKLYNFQILNPENNTILSVDKKEFEMNLVLAEQGDSTAQLKLANFFYDGKGTEQDKEKALEWYKKAVEQGNADAQRDLVNHYEAELLINRFGDKAMKWIENEARCGNAVAKNEMHLVLAIRGDSFHQVMLARSFFEKGDKGKALEWYIKAVNQGELFAIPELLEKYEVELLINRFGDKVIEWIEKGANDFNLKAQHGLAKYYYKKKNIQKALEWYTKAAKRGYYGSDYEYRVLALIQFAKEDGNVKSQYELGQLMERKHDELAALYWYYKGASQNDTKCQQCFNRLYGSNYFGGNDISGNDNKGYTKYILIFFVAVIVLLCISKFLWK